METVKTESCHNFTISRRFEGSSVERGHNLKLERLLNWWIDAVSEIEMIFSIISIIPLMSITGMTIKSMVWGGEGGNKERVWMQSQN